MELNIATTLGVYSHVVSVVYDGVAVELNAAFADTSKGSYRSRLGGSQGEHLVNLLQKGDENAKDAMEILSNSNQFSA